MVAVQIDDLRGRARRHFGGETRRDRTCRTPGRRGESETCRVSPRSSPGTNSSQMPLGMCFRMGWRRPSQSLKSPTTLTLVALGAQTAKFTPSTPSIVAQLGAEPVVTLPVRPFAQQVQVVVRQQMGKRVWIVHGSRSSFRLPRLRGVSIAERLVAGQRTYRLEQARRMNPPHGPRRSCGRNRPPRPAPNVAKTP